MAEELFGVFEQCKGGAREYAIENALIFLAHDNSSSQLGGKNNKKIWVESILCKRMKTIGGLVK